MSTLGVNYDRVTPCTLEQMVNAIEADPPGQTGTVPLFGRVSIGSRFMLDLVERVIDLEHRVRGTHGGTRYVWKGHEVDREIYEELKRLTDRFGEA